MTKLYDNRIWEPSLTVIYTQGKQSDILTIFKKHGNSLFQTDVSWAFSDTYSFLTTENHCRKVKLSIAAFLWWLTKIMLENESKENPGDGFHGWHSRKTLYRVCFAREKYDTCRYTVTWWLFLCYIIFDTRFHLIGTTFLKRVTDVYEIHSTRWILLEEFIMCSGYFRKER